MFNVDRRHPSQRPPWRGLAGALLLGLAAASTALADWQVARDTVAPAMVRADGGWQGGAREHAGVRPGLPAESLRLANNVAVAEAYPARQLVASRGAPAAGDASIAVVYPDIGEPYRSVFTKIIEGVEARARTQVFSFAVGSGQDGPGLRRALRAKEVKVVIALGRLGLQAVEGLDGEFGIVVGGVVAVPEDEARGRDVISLSPDPALLFARLRNLMPDARRVHVVYDPRQNEWLVRLAKEAARSQGLELVAQEARDLKTAVRLYQEMLANADERRDVVWLPQDPTTVEENVVLPLVLRDAWEHRLAVFSSSFGHVKRGVLFSLYPDNLGLGRNLAGSAMSFLSTGEPASRGVTPLKDVQTAVNLRTAKHLGLAISSQQQRDFDLVFTGQ